MGHHVRNAIGPSATMPKTRPFPLQYNTSLHSYQRTPRTCVPHFTAAMEDTTMLDVSQPLFQDLTFTVVPTSLSEERIRTVRLRVFSDHA